MNCRNMDVIHSLQRLFFKVRKVRKLSNLGILLLVGNFLKKCSDNICRQLGVIELFKMSLFRSERSGLVHFPLIIDVMQ